MARAGEGTAKYQAKLLKASGLQKLRYYCQLCQKQCRDANGFKSHLGSPSHMGRISNLSREGKSFSVIQEYLREFEREFLRLLKINHGTKSVDANKFYQEYILYDKDHVHMNATRWSSLTAFVKHLGQLGKVRVDSDIETDQFNLSISLVDGRMPHTGVSREKQLKTDDETLMRFVNAQVEAGKKLQRLQQPQQPQEKKTRKENASEKLEVEEEAELDVFRKSAPMALSLKGLKSKKAQGVSIFENSDDDDESNH